MSKSGPAINIRNRFESGKGFLNHFAGGSVVATGYYCLFNLSNFLHGDRLIYRNILVIYEPRYFSSMAL